MDSVYGIRNATGMLARMIHSVAEGAVVSPPIVLVVVDWVILTSAVVACLGAGARWWIRGRRRPAAFPPRTVALREDALLLAVLAYMLAGVALGWMVEGIGAAPESIAYLLVVGNGTQIVGGAVCVAVAARRTVGGIPGLLLGSRDVTLPRSPMILWAAAALGLCPLVAELTLRMILLVRPDYEFPAHATIEALQSGDQPRVVVVCLWIGAVVVAPIAEELFFRGVLQTVVFHMVRSRWLAVSLSSLVFGAVHISQPPAIGALVLLGVILGYAYERSGSLLVPIALHALFNLKTLIWGAIGPGTV